MKNKEARELEKEYNELLIKGRDLWQQIEPVGNRCNEILKTLRNANVPFDEIALIFGGDLACDLAGPPDDDASVFIEEKQ